MEENSTRGLIGIPDYIYYSLPIKRSTRDTMIGEKKKSKQAIWCKVD
jgi:hypothetical protein